MKKLISVILPCLNESENLPLLIPEIIKNIPSKYDYEIICVDDGSNDNTFSVIKKIAEDDNNVKGLSFHRRFGHQAALIAGIQKASGDAVINMDSDFQHPPEMIPKMLTLWEEGYDLVIPKKTKDSYSGFIDGIQRQLGYFIWKWMSDDIITPGVSDFRLMDRKVVKYLLNSSENEIFIRGLVKMGAKNVAYLPYKTAKRKFGKSSYNFSINKNLFLNGLISFSVKPLRIATYSGLILCISSALFLIFDFIQAIIVGRRILSGYLTIIFMMMILNGFIIFYLGILGEYIGVIFKEVKKRPRYQIDEKINLQ